MRLAEIVEVKDERKSEVFPKTPTMEELAGIQKSARIKSVEELSGLKRYPGND